jgi:hypothetical protein
MRDELSSPYNNVIPFPPNGRVGDGPPPGPPLQPPAGGGEDDLDARVAKLEAAVAHIQSDMVEIKTDIRGLRTDARTDFRLLFGALIVAVLGLAGLLAKGFHWL